MPATGYFPTGYFPPSYFPTGFFGGPDAPAPTVADIRIGLRSRLAEVTAVTALLGSDPIRVRPGLIPSADALPAVAFGLDSQRDGARLDGPDQVATARIRYTIRADSLGQALAVRKVIRDALHGYRGQPTKGPFVLRCKLADEADDSDPRDDDTDDDYHLLTLYFTVRYREP